MKRLIWLAALVFPILTLSVFTLSAQDTAGQPAAAEIFPLVPVLEELARAASCPFSCLAAWNPDWPLDLPPDAFRVNSASLSGVSLEYNGYSLEYRLDSEGRIEKFPLMLNGQMVQISLLYRDQGKIEAIELIYPDISTVDDKAEAGDAAQTLLAQGPWKFEFLGDFSLQGFRDSFPVVIRASQGDGASLGDGTSPREAWYFIYLSGGGNENLETWYDEEGNALGVFGYSLVDIGGSQRIAVIRDSANTVITRYYDSRGFLTETSGPGGTYSVGYLNEYLPRYWERRPRDAAANTGFDAAAGNFTLQWDGNGFLVRISQEDGPADYRYEYTLDEKGNWVERRETRMIQRFGFLVPAQGTTIRRVLDYNGF